MNKLIVFSAMEPLALSGDAKLAVAVIYGLFLGVLLVKCDFSDRVIVKDNLTFKSMRMLKLLLLTLALLASLAACGGQSGMNTVIFRVFHGRYM